MAYRLSAFGAKRDERTSHEKWCDEMIKRANGQKVISVKADIKKKGFTSNNYTNYELKQLF